MQSLRASSRDDSESSEPKADFEVLEDPELKETPASRSLSRLSDAIKEFHTSCKKFVEKSKEYLLVDTEIQKGFQRSGRREKYPESGTDLTVILLRKLGRFRKGIMVMLFAHSQ